MIAGIIAVLLALTPLPFEEMGIYGNGVVMTASAEETNGGETNGGETNDDETDEGEIWLSLASLDLPDNNELSKDM